MNKGKTKILIADAEEQNRALLSDMLKEKYEIVEADNGIQALRQIQDTSSELAAVLLGIAMPKMDGFEVLNTLRETGAYPNLPIIALSSPIADRFSEYAYEAGVCDFLYTPFQKEEVLQIIDEAVAIAC